jgi:hypothetical protein
MHLAVEGEQAISCADTLLSRDIFQRGQVPGPELAERVGGVAGALEELEKAPVVIQEILGVLVVHSVDLAVCGTLLCDNMLSELWHWTKPISTPHRNHTSTNQRDTQRTYTFE